jgi:predicted Abi (CAAX) family protease
MTSGLKTYRARLIDSLRTWPTAREWMVCGLIALVILTAMFALGLATGLYQLTETRAGLPLRLVQVFFVPAMGEELFFRGLLIPSRRETASHIWPLRISLALYVAWHVVEALTFLPQAAPVFLRLDFLICCGFLGIGCGIMKSITGSVWPAVILHWVLVVVWQTWLGGVSALA